MSISNDSMGACQSLPRGNWLPAEGEVVEDHANRRIGRVVSYAQGPHCTVNLVLTTLTDDGTGEWACPLTQAKPLT